MSGTQFVSLLLLAALAGSGAVEQVSIQLLHINDNHARFDPADANFGTQCTGDQAAACFGGFARLSTAISERKAAAARQGIDTLVLHAGDQYTGSLWDAVYTKNGIQIAPYFLEQLGVQAFTVGNHEFDFGATGDAGLQGFAQNVSGAFPILSCNLDVSGEPALEGLVERFTLIELQYSNLTVGVVGLTSSETPATSNPGPTVKFLPHSEALPGCVADARAAGADFIIALTHIGFDDDKVLAGDPAAAGVDLIVGGHSHTLLYGAPPAVGERQVGTQPPPILVSPPKEEGTTAQGPYGTLVLNPASGKTIPVLQALYASRYLGVLNTTWEAGSGLVSYSGQPVLLGGANSTNPVADDPAVVAALNVLRGPIDQYNNQMVGTSSVDLEGDRGAVRNGETNLGDLACLALYQFTSNSTGLLADNPDKPAVCLINGGSIRASIFAGNVTQGSITAVFPFGNYMVAKLVDGPTLAAALNSGLSGWTGNDSAEGRFPQVGGMRLAFDPSRPADSRLVGAEVMVNGSAAPLDSYTGSLILLTTDYVAGGGDFYTMLKDEPVAYDSSTPLDVLVADYFEQSSPVNITTDGRIANCADTPSEPLCSSAEGGPVGEAGSPPTGAAAPRQAGTGAGLLLSALAACVLLFGRDCVTCL